MDVSDTILLPLFVRDTNTDQPFWTLELKMLVNGPEPSL